MRRTETSTLAFLDVMACGLGAVILILVVLKQQAPVDNVQPPAPAIDTSQTEAEIARLETEITRLEDVRMARQNDLDKDRETVAATQAKINQASADLAAADSQASQLDASLNAHRKILTELSTEPPTAIVETPTITQPQYLVGLTVSGRKIVILLDRSASMTARELVQIIQYKAGPEAARRQAEKWQRALNAVWWLTARAPQNARLQIASFSEATKFHSAGWVAATDGPALTSIQTEMASLTPEGGTNLEAAITAAIKTGADHIYVITDGLPTTAPGGQSLLGLDGCGSKLSSRKQVTGACRISLFQRTVAAAAGHPARISIVLMPLEGDPDAAPLFSKWALSKGGVLLSAARNWP